MSVHSGKGRGPGHMNRKPQGVGSTAPAGLLGQMPTGVVGLWPMGDYLTSPRPYVPNLADTVEVNRSLAGPGRRAFGQSVFWTCTSLTVVDANATAPDGSGDATTISRAAGGAWYVYPKLMAGANSELPNGNYAMGINVRWTGTGSPDFKLGMFSAGLTSFTATTSWQRFTVNVTVTGGTAWLMLSTPDSTSACSFEICDFEVFPGSVDLGPQQVSSAIYFQKIAYNNAAPTLTNALLGVDNGNNMGYLQLPTARTMNAFSFCWTAKMTSTGNLATLNSFLADFASENNFSLYAINNGTTSIRMSSTTFGGVPQSLMEQTRYNTTTNTVTYDGTTVRWYSGGFLMGVVTGTATARAIRDLYFNNIRGQYWNGHQMATFAMWNRALSYTEVQQAAGALDAYTVDKGTAIEPARVWAFEGDSITAGGGVVTTPYPVLARNSASPIVRAPNVAVGGSTIATVQSRAAALDAYLPPNKNGKKFGCSLLLGANDFASAPYLPSPSAWTDLVLPWVQARKAAGWDYVVVATAISNTINAGGAAYDANRDVINPIIRGWVGTETDGVFDFAANALIGANGAADNLTYFVDKVHMTNTGQVEAGNIATPVINALWTY